MERRQGTLELLVAAPAPFVVVIFALTLAMSTIGAYSMVTTLLWGRLVFGIEITVDDPLAFALAVVATVIAVGMLGFLLAVSSVRYRTAWALGAALELPVWLICGFLVPLSLLRNGCARSRGCSPRRGDGRDPRGDPGWDSVRRARRVPRTRRRVRVARCGNRPVAPPFRAAACRAVAELRSGVSSVRLFFVGGITSYRALFAWMSPWIFIPSFIVTPLFQILFFAYAGRAAGVADDRFFLIGNAVQFASIPCLFAMGNAIANERREQTLGLILVTPARRIPLFLGRALPVIVNGFLVTVVAFVLGGWPSTCESRCPPSPRSPWSSRSPPTPAPGSDSRPRRSPCACARRRCSSTSSSACC
jgi:hypothetical protein